MAPGAKNKFGALVVEPAPTWSKFGAPMVEPELFRKQIYCTEESTCDIVGTFRRPQWLGARGIAPHLPPLRYAPVLFIKIWI